MLNKNRWLRGWGLVSEGQYLLCWGWSGSMSWISSMLTKCLAWSWSHWQRSLLRSWWLWCTGKNDRWMLFWSEPNSYFKIPWGGWSCRRLVCIGRWKQPSNGKVFPWTLILVSRSLGTIFLLFFFVGIIIAFIDGSVKLTNTRNINCKILKTALRFPYD